MLQQPCGIPPSRIFFRFGIQAKNDSFERCSVDNFVIEDLDVGIIKKIRVGHDNSGAGEIRCMPCLST